MNKTVTFLLADFQSGGTEWVAYRLALGLKKEGDSISFAATSLDGELYQQVRENFPVIALNGSGYSLKSAIRSLPALRRHLKKEAPDVLISGLPLLNLAASAAKMTTASRTKLVCVEHMRPINSPDQRGLKPFLKKLLMTFTHCVADKVVYVSNTVAQDFGFNQRKVKATRSVIYNPVIPDNIKDLQTGKAPHPWLAPSRTGPVIISIGRLLPIKGHAMLIEAFARLSPTLPDAKLLIFGEGQEREALTQLVRSLGLRDKVGLPGSLDNVFPALMAADLFALSSYSEAFGNVVVESLACGTKVVSTPCGGPNEILSNGEYGIISQDHSAKAFSEAIKQALASTFEKEALVTRAHTYSVDAATKKYSALLLSLCSP